MLLIINDDFIQIAEVDGEPAAFIVMLPNVNEAIADLNGRLLPFGWAETVVASEGAVTRTAHACR